MVKRQLLNINRRFVYAVPCSHADFKVKNIEGFEERSQVLDVVYIVVFPYVTSTS